MPRAVSARRRWDPWVAPTNISLRRGAACLALFQHAVGGEGRPWVAPTNISLFVGRRDAFRCFFMTAAGMRDPWDAPTNISLRRGAACLALFQHAGGGEGGPMGRPYEYLSS